MRGPAFALPLMLRETHQARERRLWLAALTAQERNEAMQRRAFVPVKGSQINLLELTAAGTDDIEKVKPGGNGNTDHRRPAGPVSRSTALHKAFHRVTASTASARCAASAYISASRFSRPMSLSDGRMPTPGFRPGVGRRATPTDCVLLAVSVRSIRSAAVKIDRFVRTSFGTTTAAHPVTGVRLAAFDSGGPFRGALDTLHATGLAARLFRCC